MGVAWAISGLARKGFRSKSWIIGIAESCIPLQLWISLAKISVIMVEPSKMAGQPRLPIPNDHIFMWESVRTTCEDSFVIWRSGLNLIGSFQTLGFRPRPRWLSRMWHPFGMKYPLTIVSSVEIWVRLNDATGWNLIASLPQACYIVQFRQIQFLYSSLFTYNLI